MPAQANHTVWTAFLSPTTSDVAVGYCLIADSAGDYYVIATSANRTAASRTTCVAGIAITAGDSSNRAVEVQTVGPCPPEITLLGTGSAGPIIVNSSGRLERKALPISSDVVAGKCDADGWAYLNFASRDGGDSTGASFGGSNGDVVIRASATTSTGVSPGTSGNVLTSNGSAWTSAAPAAGITVNGSTKDLLFKTSSTVIDPIGAWTREASGRVNVTSSGYITYGPTGSTYPTTGLIRTAQQAPATTLAVITGIESGESATYNAVAVDDLGPRFGDAAADTLIQGAVIEIDGPTDMLGQLGIYDSNVSHRYLIGVSNLTANRTCTLPLLTGDDTFTFNDFAATLQNKSLGTGTAITTATITNTSQVKMTVLSETYSATTTDATTSNLATFTLTDNAITGLDVIITATTSGATSAARYKRSAALKRASGTAVQVGSTRDDATDENSAAWDSTIDLSGTTARVRITGEAGTTITWTCELRRQTGTP